MRKVLRVVWALLLINAVQTTKANPVDMRLAREVGTKFVNVNTAMRVSSESDLQWITTYRTANDDAAFHVFNTAKGFVIVSADDCATPILGYSEDGPFDLNNIPVQMEEYLQGFVEQIQYGVDHHLTADETIAQQWEQVKATGYLTKQRSTTAVSPLLTDTWNQNCYYNNLCPEDSNGPCGHVYVGCTGTAMGQIMHYWGYPTSGSGSVTYTPSGYPQQSVNFAATTYQWNNMPNNLNSSSSSTQVNAVATLLWHCGVALRVTYGPDGTSGAPSLVPSALTDNFNYSTDLYGAYRSNYDNNTWLSMIKTCLDYGRPIHYSGWNSSGGGGHSFVCDGYDANNYLHFNWGWSGSGNNYFVLDALTVNGYDFSYNNYAVFDIHPSCPPGTTYQVNASASPSYGGTVSGAGSYNCGSGCNLTAVPANGYMFCSWTENGTIVSYDQTYSFTVMSNRNLVANFVSGEGCALEFNLSDSFGDGWTGNALTVSYSAGCNSYEELTLESGSSTVITRNVVDGSHIVLGWVSGQWVGECSFSVSYGDGSLICVGSDLSNGFSYEFDVDCDNTSANAFNITAMANPMLGGMVSGGGSFVYGQTCTLTATPYMGYRFVNWTKNGTVVSVTPTYSFAAMEDAALVANFATITQEMQVVAQYYPDANNPNSQYVRVSWANATLSSSPESEFGMTSDRSLYSVYRANCDGSDMQMIANNVNNSQYIDYNWANLPLGNYVYGVCLAGGKGDVSEIRWNNTPVALNHHTVDVSDINKPIADHGTLGEPSRLTYDNGWLYYDNGSYATNVGMGDGSTVYWGIMYPSDMLVSYTGNVLSKVALYENSYNTNPITLSIYLGGTSTPGTLAYTNVFNPIGGNGFHEISLGQQTVSIDGTQNLWIVFSTSGTYPAVASYDTGDPNGRWFSFDGTYWYDLANVGMSGYCWMIRGFVENAGNAISWSNCIGKSVVLNEGWNWWSSYVELTGLQGLSMLEEGLYDNGISIKSQNAFVDYSGQYGWSGTLLSINNESGYKILVAERCASILSGVAAQPENHPITLNPSWNWIGYPASNTQSVTSAMSGFQPMQGDVIKGQEGFVTYESGLGWTPSTFTLNPGKGYMYYSNATTAKTFVYAQSKRETLPLEYGECYWKVDRHAYVDNLSLMATVEVAGVEQHDETLELGAFVNGECRGSAKLYYVASIDRYIAFLTVTGQEGEEVEFKLLDESKATSTSRDHITFHSNAIVGSLDNPMPIHFGAMNGVAELQTNMSVYPNPVDRNASFALAIPEEETVAEVLVVNALGEVVSREKGSLNHSMKQGLPASGVYMVKVTCESGNVYQGRIMVK